MAASVTIVAYNVSTGDPALIMMVSLAWRRKAGILMKEKRKFFSKRKLIITLSVILGLFVISFSTYLIDKSRVENKQIPIFILAHSGYEDGGTHIYYGLGYQIIIWDRISNNDPDLYKSGVEVHYLFGITGSMTEPQVELTEGPPYWERRE